MASLVLVMAGKYEKTCRLPMGGEGIQVGRSGNPTASGVKQFRIDEQHVRAFARRFQQGAVEAVLQHVERIAISADVRPICAAMLPLVHLPPAMAARTE